MKLILFDVFARKVFDVVNIFQKKYDYDLVLCSAKDYRWKLPLIYGRKVYRLRVANYPDFRSDLTEILADFPGEELVFLAVSELSTRFFLDFVAEFEPPQLKFLLPSSDGFDITRNKKSFQGYCERHSFPVPASYVKEDLGQLRKSFKPLVLKPKTGHGGDGIRFVNDVAGLDAFQTLNFDDYVVQERVTGSGEVQGAFFLCAKGQVVASYTHQRIRTFPVKGGVTVYSKSAKNEEILAIGGKLLESLEWSGFAMIEFMFDSKDNQWKMIELNPRLWGSVMLSEFNNSGFLDNYVRLCTGRKTEEDKIREDVYIRWLYPFDLLNWLTGKISTREFFRIRRDVTCYINWSYTNYLRAILFMIYFSVNKRMIKRFINKIYGT